MGFYIQDDYWEALSEQPTKTQDAVFGAMVRLYFTQQVDTQLSGVSKAFYVAFRERIVMARSSADRQCKKRKKSVTNNVTDCVTDCVTKTQSVTGKKGVAPIREGEGDITTTVVIPPKPPEGVVREIIDYLNEKTGKAYKATTPKTIQLIKARTAEGFTLDDFKAAIDNQVREWKGDAKMDAFLRPETLFGSKFEGYVNNTGKGGSSDKWAKYA